MNDPEVIVIGAGPAGASAAAILAERGRRVTIVERQPFPRYRIGESLIPYCWFPLDRLGLVDALDESAFVVRKHSVQFVGTDGAQTVPFYFNRHTDHDCARTWQVQRPDFDVMLLDNAIEKGATIMRQTTARELIVEDDRVVGVVIEDAKGVRSELRAALTIDASGRDLFAVSKQGWRVADAKLRKIAIWSYFEGAERDCGIDEGATTIAYLPDKGWFWYIPLPHDSVSVGAVAERDYLYRGPRDPDAILEREIAVQPWVAAHLEGSTKLEPARVTGDYSYRAKHVARDGLVLVGDAFGFLDPVFSSGVFLALRSGVDAGETAADALDAGDCSAASFTEYGVRFRRGIEAMRVLVHAFYDTGFSFAEFLTQHADLRETVTDLLIGRVDRDFDALFAALREYADVPPPLEHGHPLIEGTHA